MTGITALLKIELPTGDVLLTDGGVTQFGGQDYVQEHPVIGALSEISPLEEGSSDSIPDLELNFAPPTIMAATEFSNGAIQRSNVSLWVAEYDTLTGDVIGTPDLRFSGFVDQPFVGVSFGEYQLSITAVPQAEFLFTQATGNDLSAAFHKKIYPNETGHDQASALPLGVAWGISSPPQARSTSSGASAGRFGSSTINNALSLV